ncbi:carbohydrate kinase [Fertoebacter nigrum]|uniref:Carbohydrate kinase n=1 Tax=Fertoeibacter niger TaxID=2656921 RepID=A0A8X8H2B7_9RHOB|nr:FGGY-family carbohydrate kinase [Fertoeibacter niger]NUB45805.1 carbohydrate kinase [Fertoeibacter niger]
MTRHVAVIDIGKTNAKLALVNRDTLTEIDVVTQPNRVRPGPPYPRFDTEGHWNFVLAGLRDFHARHGIDAISITTHGACAALLAADGTLAAPVLDYEHDGPHATAAAYTALRPDFAETGSPRLALGLNLGAQLHWQFARDPGLLARTAQLVTWPQYWGHRLTGVTATDLCSLGCHTDLWNPAQGALSSLVGRLGLAGKIAAPRKPSDILGPILPAIAAATGLVPGTPVACGIHDSNASLLPHLLARAAPFAVVSTGTWVVTMAVGGSAPPMDAARDTLINVDAFGAPVRSARFMGGREYEVIRHGESPAATPGDMAQVLRDRIMLFPTVEPSSGPFPGRQAEWTQPEPQGGARMAALAFYLALMTAECLAITGADGPVIVEGPFAQNELYCAMLAVATGRAVQRAGSQTGTSIGAALLFGPPARPVKVDPVADPQHRPAMQAYAAEWRGRVGA